MPLITRRCTTLTGGGHVSAATLIKKLGEAPVLFCQDMEREEAAKSGLKCLSYSLYNYEELLKQANGDPVMASALRYQRMLTDLGLTHGRIGLYGLVEIGSAFAAFTSPFTTDAGIGTDRRVA